MRDEYNNGPFLLLITTKGSPVIYTTIIHLNTTKRQRVRHIQKTIIKKTTMLSGEKEGKGRGRRDEADR